MMRRVSSMRFPFTLFFLFALVFSLQSGQAQEMAENEKAVWQLEEDYWVYVQASDLDAYRTLWDDRFVGWPSFSPDPLGVKDISSWIPPLHQNPAERFQYELTPKAVREFGDIVVAHYLVREFWKSADTGEVVREERVRITHTWQRVGDTWRIITGMSSLDSEG